MRTRRPLLAATAILTTLCLSAASAAPLHESAAVTVDLEGGASTGLAAVLTAEGFHPAAIASLREVKRHASEAYGRTYLTYEQRVGRLPVHSSTLRVTIEEDGSISRVTHRLANFEDAGAILSALPR